MRPAKIVFSVLSLIVLLTAHAWAAPDAAGAYGRLPLSFESNRGQADPEVTYLSRQPGQTLLLKQDTADLLVAGETVQLRFDGALQTAKVEPHQPLPGLSNYYSGNDPRQWLTHIPNFGSVEYANLYRGVSVIYHGEAGQL